MKKEYKGNELKARPTLNLTHVEVLQMLAVMNFAVDENFYGHEETGLFSADDEKQFQSAFNKLKVYKEQISGDF